MKKPRPNPLLLLFTLLILPFLVNCEKTQEIEVGVLWQDDQSISSSQDHFLAILDGSYDAQTGFDADLVALTSVSPGVDHTQMFTLSASSRGYYTAFVFVDTDADGAFEDGTDLVCGYKHNSGDPESRLQIALRAYY